MSVLTVVGDNIRTRPIIKAPGLKEGIELALVAIQFDDATNKGLWWAVGPVRIGNASFRPYFHFITWSTRRTERENH